MNMGFVILYVRDREKVKRFYTEVLGMPAIEGVSGPNFITLRTTGGSLLALQNKAASQLPPGLEEQPGSVELSFEADDVDATWKHWKESGVAIVTEPMDLPFGRYFLAQDPEGHYLSVYRFAQQPATSPEGARQTS